jgi:hypothetical protein
MVVREVLWWELGKKGLSTEFIEGVKGIYKNVKISVKLDGNRVLDEFDSNIGLRRGCSLSPALLNIFIDDALVESRMMTGVEIWGSEDRWKDVKKVYELFCKE